ncbi:hypothetical protein VT06_06420 [Arsukibacterium sp. MJ3]|uniref:ABC transporter ATP-binding protein n=1 Tax=Arsukibacterium sp. MJ3 TaxID=1632859 RepID=UPI0006271977|nr:ATP-binding cassette domain-containing protein [Arsukibacterium sp. MJ3]KKO49462.1 hypothetical protein VT06_06420 [Arsukibacterium sp. MJ3]
MSLTINNLSLTRGDQIIFHHYQLALSHRRHCLHAANGTGKSSLLCTIAGLLPLNGGTIHWQGQPVQSVQQQIAIASDSVLLPEFITAKNLLQLSQSNWQLRWPQQLIDAFAFTAQLQQTVANLSAGNLKKLQLILAFMRQPALLLLDEPDIALDEPAQLSLWQLINDYPGTIVAASNTPESFVRQGFELVRLHAL